MATLTHFRLCPFSRSVRLVLGELHWQLKLVEEQPWEYRPAFLSLNPAATLPVLQLTSGAILCGAGPIAEYIAEETPTHPVDGLSVPLFPGDSLERAEVRRLVDWFQVKTHNEATRHLLEEKLYKLFRKGHRTPTDAGVMRAARHNLAYSLDYMEYLFSQDRPWLAGDEMSFADLAAAAHLSLFDYFNELRWETRPRTRLWYARIKSRASMRAILAERYPNTTPPPPHYADPDF